jgi:hypothetical protein
MDNTISLKKLLTYGVERIVQKDFKTIQSEELDQDENGKLVKVFDLPPGDIAWCESSYKYFYPPRYILSVQQRRFTGCGITKYRAITDLLKKYDKCMARFRHKNTVRYIVGTPYIYFDNPFSITMNISMMLGTITPHARQDHHYW